MTETAVHPYYVNKARKAFKNAQGNPDNAIPLAEWAQEWGKKELSIRGTDERHAVDGVLVAEDGTIVGEYFTVRDVELSVRHVTAETREKYNLAASVLDMATTSIQRIIGQKIIHVSGYSVATGARADHDFS